MGKILGPMIFMAGLFLLLPGFAAIVNIGDPGVPDWLVRDLLLASLCGGALMVWGGALIRDRELALNNLEPIRIRVRR